jgi:hypothetical protein
VLIAILLLEALYLKGGGRPTTPVRSFPSAAYEVHFPAGTAVRQRPGRFPLRLPGRAHDPRHGHFADLCSRCAADYSARFDPMLDRLLI